MSTIRVSIWSVIAGKGENNNMGNKMTKHEFHSDFKKGRKQRHGLSVLLVFSLLLAMMLGNGFSEDPIRVLEASIRAGDTLKVKAMLTNGGESLRNNVASNAPHYLRLSARFGSVDLVRMLMREFNLSQDKAALGDALVVAMDNDQFDSLVPFLIKLGAEPSHQYLEMTALGRLGYLYAGNREDVKRVVETARLLLEHGAEINRFDQTGKTPLMAACESDNPALIKLYLAHGANPFLQNKDAETAWTLAKTGTRAAAALKSGKKANPPVTGVNAQSDMPGKNTPPREEPSIHEPQSFTMMQLSEAVAFGDAEAVQRLLAKGIHPDTAVNRSGLTVLMQAANARVARLLLEAGADVNKRDSRGWSPLHYAVTRKTEPALIRLLIQSGADVSIRNLNGETPLRLTGILFVEKIAPAWGKILIPILVKNGADIHTADHEGHTLLHQAAFNDNPDLAAVCIRLGADPDWKLKEGKSAREVALQLNSREFLNVIRK